MRPVLNGGTALIVPLLAGQRLYALLATFLSLAALSTPTAEPSAQFASGVNLVEVYVTVTDPQGNPVTGLSAADFHVSEEGEAQRITAFAAGEFPLAIAIGLDRSFSMRDRLPVAKSAARTLAGALRPGDELMVVAIGSETEVVAPLSTDRGTALAAIDRLDAWGTTSLYDATIAAIEDVQPAKGRRALVLLSDGADRFSRATATEVVERARRSDVLVYPIALGRVRPPVFAELAAVTGGRSVFDADPRGLQAAMTAIARELRFQYLLGYVPGRPSTDEPEWRSIQVSVDRPDVKIRSRDGYLAR